MKTCGIRLSLLFLLFAGLADAADVVPTEVQLPGTQQAEAFSTYVSGDNVYVAGYDSNGSKNVTKYWINGN